MKRHLLLCVAGLALSMYAVGQNESERIARLEAKIEQLTPVVQEVNDLRVQLAQLQGKLDSLDTKLNIALTILGAIGLAVLGELAKKVSDRLGGGSVAVKSSRIERRPERPHGHVE